MKPPAMVKIATILDIAAYCGVSKSTVSRALLNAGDVLPATRDRVLAAAQALGYEPAYHEAARRLAASHRGQIGPNYVVGLFFPPDFHRLKYYTRLMGGILDVLVAEGYTLVMTYTPPTGQPHATLTLPPIFGRGDIDAVIGLPLLLGFETLLAQLRSNPRFGERPVVSLMAPFDSCTLVGTDDEQGAYLAARHLLAQGHRHLLQFISHKDTLGLLERRVNGVRRALHAHGLSPNEHLHFYIVPVPWLRPGFQDHRPLLTGTDLTQLEQQEAAFLDYLRDNPVITAILTTNDASAIYVWYLLRRAGLRLPEEMSIVGFDDTDRLVDDEGNNILTTVRLPFHEAGSQAARAAIAHILGDTPQPATLLPCELVVRGSVCPPGR